MTTAPSASFSPLALQLQELVARSLVRLDPMPKMDFPTAYVVVSVFDSGGTAVHQAQEPRIAHAQLARHIG